MPWGSTKLVLGFVFSQSFPHWFLVCCLCSGVLFQGQTMASVLLQVFIFLNKQEILLTDKATS